MAAEVLEVPLTTVRGILRQREFQPPQYSQDAIDHLRELFPKWKGKIEAYLDAGFNILLHGLGSKRPLIHEFVTSCLAEDDQYRCLEVKGFDPRTTVDTVLKSLGAALGVFLPASLNEVELAKRLKADVERKEEFRLLIALHNIDGPSLRAPSSQDALSILAASERVVFLSSVDHVNCQLLWDRARLSRFHWIHQQADTLSVYAQEIVSGDSRVLGLTTGGGQRKHTLASLNSVWASLTANAKKPSAGQIGESDVEVFVLLVNLWQESRRKDGSGGSVAYTALYRAAKRDFIEKGLAHLLVEFQDHAMVAGKKGGDGSESFSLLVPLPLLKSFLTSHNLHFDDE